MKLFSGLSLIQWENQQKIKEASKMYWLGEQTAIIFLKFQSSLYYEKWANGQKITILEYDFGKETLSSVR